MGNSELSSRDVLNKNTYSVAFGEDRIAEIREMSRLTGLKQGEILKTLWDDFKIQAVEKLLANRGETLDKKLKSTSKLVRDLTSAAKEG